MNKISLFAFASLSIIVSLPSVAHSASFEARSQNTNLNLCPAILKVEKANKALSVCKNLSADPTKGCASEVAAAIGWLSMVENRKLHFTRLKNFPASPV